LPHPFANIGEPFISFSQVGSTNDEARKAIQNGLATHGMAFFSTNQVAGRGQRGRSWQGEPGASLALSVLIKTDFLTVLQQFELSMAVALGVWEGVAGSTGSESLQIKWPNDLYWKDQKLGGILIESVLNTAGQWPWAIVGIGINVNQKIFDPALPNPISLFQISGQEQEPAAVAKRLCGTIGNYLEQLQEKKSDALLAAYNRLLYKKEQIVRFKSGDRLFSAVVKEVSQQGLLCLENEPHQYTTGSIEWIQ
jgi:BirA family biotin operon repressor/biotin-[acetyl-CoA-carboxylase] ligase